MIVFCHDLFIKRITHYRDVMESLHSCKWLQEGLDRLFQERRHCDVTLDVDGEHFRCHKTVLAAASVFFDAMFSTDMVESRSEKINLIDIKPSVMEVILKFIYSGRDVASADNVEDLIQAASRFQIAPLKDHCEDVLLSEVSDENCVGLWVTGKTLQCERLRNAAWDVITTRFDDVRKSQELLRLDKADFLEIIQSNALNASNEEYVCKMALKWVLFDEFNRKRFFPEILFQLRLCQVSLEFLLEEIFSFKYGCYDEACTTLLKNAVKYHALPDRRHLFDSLSVRPRNNSTDISLIVVIGRRTVLSEPQRHETECIGYCSHEDTWYSLCSIPVDSGDYFATCPYGNDILVSGGTLQPNSMFYFSAKQFKWLEKANMWTGRYRHAMVGLRDSVFVLGGYNFGAVASVEEFDIRTNMWETVGELHDAVDAASASVIGEKIYVFGGWKGFTEETAAIQCFDTRTNTSTVIGTLPSPQRNTHSLTFNRHTYITFSNGEIHTFKSDGRTKMVHRLENFSRKHFGVYKDKSTLYILGGSTFDEDSVDDYDDEKVHDTITHMRITDGGVTSLPTKLPVPLEVYGCFNTLIRQKYPLVKLSEVLDFMSE